MVSYLSFLSGKTAEEFSIHTNDISETIRNQTDEIFKINKLTEEIGSITNELTVKVFKPTREII